MRKLRPNAVGLTIVLGILAAAGCNTDKDVESKEGIESSLIVTKRGPDSYLLDFDVNSTVEEGALSVSNKWNSAEQVFSELRVVISGVQMLAFDIGEGDSVDYKMTMSGKECTYSFLGSMHTEPIVRANLVISVPSGEKECLVALESAVGGASP